MYIFEIIPGTPQHEKMNNIFNWKKQFDNPEFQAEFEKAIGVPINKNLACTTHGLELETIPEGTRNQFCKYQRTGQGCMFYAAKKNSKLNQAYLGLVKKI